MAKYLHLNEKELLLVINGYKGHIKADNVSEDIINRYRKNADETEIGYINERVESHYSTFRRLKSHHSIEHSVMKNGIELHRPGREERRKNLRLCSNNLTEKLIAHKPFFLGSINAER